MINFPINNQAATHPAAERHIKDRGIVGPSAAHSFSQRGDVRVVIDSNCNAQEFCCPTGQREVRPAFDLMRAAG